MEPYDSATFHPEKGAIYTLDIETSSLFEFDDGSFRCFDYSKKPSFYAGRRKLAVPYIWMFGVDDKVYYGRDFRQLLEVFELISRDDRKEIVWIHNLGFETEFMFDLFEGMHFERVIASALRHPIAYTVVELNLQFRCTYHLTNMTLEKAAATYTDVSKRVGDLDYNQVRSPRTDLTETELGYCEYDIICLYKIVLHFKKKYRRLHWIPYTSTGEIRKAYRNMTTFSHRCWIAKRTPSDLVYLKLQKAFQGGITHTNIIYLKEIMEMIDSYDIASSYPYIMLTHKMPMGSFMPCSPERAEKLNRDTWCVLFHVRFFGIKSKKLNKYILNSKIVASRGVKADNGRLVKAEMVEMYLTDIDYDIICKDAYSFDRKELLDCECCVKDYLPITLQKYIIQLYKAKTELRGIPEKEDEYRESKARLNGLYGCAVTNILKSGVTIKDGEWIAPDLTLDYIHEKLEDLRTKRMNCFLYSWGVWITAAARARLWTCISALDDLVVYYDTDSVKCVQDPRVKRVIESENQKVIESLKRLSKEREIPMEDLQPIQPDGKRCIIGKWDYECTYDQFRALGAKKYAYVLDGELHVTVSGVNRKTGYKALKGDIRNFRPNLVFDYEAADKLTSVYAREPQPEVIIRDKDGKVWKNVQKHGIVLMPAEYSLDITAELEAYYEEMTSFKKEGTWIF